MFTQSHGEASEAGAKEWGRPLRKDRMNKPTDMKPAETMSLWINGARQAAQSTRVGDVTNPATGEIVRRVPFCNDADIDTAVQAAKAAFPKWRKTPSLRRARI